MKRLLIAVLGIALIPAVQAQVSITDTSVSLENFNNFAGTAATVPANFTFSDNDYDPGGFYTRSEAYNTSNSNYGLRDTPTSTDIAFGQKGPASGTDFLNWSFVNNTGSDILSFEVTWNFEQYSSAGRATTLTFNYNPNGSGFTTAGIVGSNVSTASTSATAMNLAAVFVEPKMVTVTPLTAIPNGGTLVLGWGFANGAGTGSNAHIGVDDTTFQVVPEPSTVAMLMGGFGMLTLLRRRRA